MSSNSPPHPGGAPGPRSVEYRTAVVGAGLVGIEVANRLAAAGDGPTLVIEAGQGEELRHANIVHAPETATRMWLEPQNDSAFIRPWSTLNPPHYAGASGVRQRLGGRSLYWYGVVLPIEDWALDDPHWPAAVVSDLRVSWCDGPSLYERTTDRLRRWAERDEVDSAPVELPSDARLGPFALRATPLARRTYPHGRWRAYSPLDEWRDPTSGRWHGAPEGVELLTGTRVLGVLLRDGRCRGVRVRSEGGAQAEIVADRVILCAGTMENSRLALQALTASGRTTTRLPGLRDHMVQGLLWRWEGEAARRLLRALPSGSYYEPHGPPVRSNLLVDVHAPEPNGAVLVEVRAMGEQHDQGTSFVEGEPRGDQPWSLRVHSEPSAADEEVLAHQRELLRRCHRELCTVAGVAPHPLRFADYGHPDPGNRVLLPEFRQGTAPGEPITWSNQLGTEDHEGGTLPIGGLLDEEQGFRDIPALYAAGPATFPRPGAANPSLTTFALAHRLAHHLAGRPSPGSRTGPGHDGVNRAVQKEAQP
ncbi:FAD-binding protein [Streptomyces sedi]|uniref:GMC family oxidoreductase n=1 Tax=Streptomyces sedi TaxID=555059 RepID=A0A5C4UQA8_9ACTN|nr:FAD-binding protein [Streptomyces sedi]TNM25861.1 GMC family oxidoreductase [Streptomyces sedi]